MSSSLKIARKRGKLPEKEGDCLKMKEMCRQLHDMAICQLHCSFLVQFLVFFVVSSPSQALFPGS